MQGWTRRNCLAAILASPISIRAGTAQAVEVSVADAEALRQALRLARPGDVLRLAPGDYGELSLRGTLGSDGKPVTLAASDPLRPPRFSRMSLRDVAHLLLDGLAFFYDFSLGDELHIRPFAVRGARDLMLQNCQFRGDRARGRSPVDDGKPTGFGLVLQDLAGYALKGCAFSSFYNGLHVSQSTNGVIEHCNIQDMRMDGIKLAQVQGLKIEDNHIHDFDRALNSEDHSDMIQMWTARTDSPSTDLVIRGNLLASGQGHFTQSIFFRNDLVDTKAAGQEMFYRNILIEENLIANAHVHGITIGETDGLTIRRNAVLRNPISQGERENPRLWRPAIRVATLSRQVVIAENFSGGILGDQGADWQVRDNVNVQDSNPRQPDYFENLFVGDPSRPETLRLRPGSLPAGKTVGPARLRT